MSDLSVRFEREEQTLRPLFESVPGLNWNALPTTVRASHQVFGTHVFAGRAKVERGSGVGARLIAKIFGFPPASSSIEVEVVKTREGQVEHWQRRFGSRRFHSQLAPLAARMTERFGPFVFELGLNEHHAALHFPVRRGWLLGIPLPRWLLPRSEAREYERDGRFHFDVALHAPCGAGLVVRYSGWLEPVP